MCVCVLRSIINENNLDIEIWDYDRFSADDKVGTCTVSLAQVRGLGYSIHACAHVAI